MGPVGSACGEGVRLMPNIKPTDEANAPLIYPAIWAKCSDDGQGAGPID